MTREEAIADIRDNIKPVVGGKSLDIAIKALEQEPCEDDISRQAVLEMAYDMSEIDGEHFTEPWMVIDVEDIQKLPSVNPQEPKWIPIKTRPLTDKEKKEYAYLGYSDEEFDFMYDCLLPEDGEEVLITTRYDEVKTDTFYRDEGGYFESYCDEDDVKAWMSLPKPYKEENEDK